MMINVYGLCPFEMEPRNLETKEGGLKYKLLFRSAELNKIVLTDYVVNYSI